MDAGAARVNELVGTISPSLSAVSQHLALLRAEWIVTVRIDAQTRWYRLKDPVVSGIIHTMGQLFGVIVDPVGTGQGT